MSSSIATTNRPGKKLPKGSKYKYAVATTVSGSVAKKGRELREVYGVSLAPIVRGPVINGIEEFYNKVQAGLANELCCVNDGSTFKKSQKQPKLHVATQVDAKTHKLLRRLKKKTYVCIAQLIRQPVEEAINTYQDRRAA